MGRTTQVLYSALLSQDSTYSFCRRPKLSLPSLPAGVGRARGWRVCGICVVRDPFSFYQKTARQRRRTKEASTRLEMGKEGFCKQAICCVPRMCITKPNIPVSSGLPHTHLFCDGGGRGGGGSVGPAPPLILRLAENTRW